MAVQDREYLIIDGPGLIDLDYVRGSNYWRFKSYLGYAKPVTTSCDFQIRARFETPANRPGNPRRLMEVRGCWVWRLEFETEEEWKQRSERMRQAERWGMSKAEQAREQALEKELKERKTVYLMGRIRLICTGRIRHWECTCIGILRSIITKNTLGQSDFTMICQSVIPRFRPGFLILRLSYSGLWVARLWSSGLMCMRMGYD